MKIIQYKPVDKGATKGYITLFVPKWELTIYNITLYEKDGKMWISFPSKSYEKDGQTKWFSFMRFEKPEQMEAFSAQVINAWKGYQPKAPSALKPQAPMQRAPAPVEDYNDGLPF